MKEYQSRDDIPPQYKWDLSDLFASVEAWETCFKEIKDALPGLASFKGKLHDKKELKAFFDAEHAVSLKAERLFVYAKMSRDQDNGNNDAVALCDRAYSLLVQADTQTAYVVPELNELDDKTLLAYAADPVFADRSFFLQNLVREKAHVLSEEAETILALSGEMASSFDTIFTMLDDVDMTFADIKKGNGEMLPVSHGRYGLYLQDKDREVRRQAYASMYDAHKAHINTLASLYGSSVKKDVFYARVRKHSSALEGELFGGNIPVTVYSGLIDAVHDALPQMHRYVALRKKLLGVDDMKMYDMYVPLVENDDHAYTYEEAQAIAEKALRPLGEEYIALLKKAFNERWIDVYETKGKTSGAYSWGSYGVHPYMLLNFQGRLEDIFTLVHESGHSMHTYFSDTALPYEKAQYRIFVAEVASTVNEVLLLKYLLGTTDDKKTRAYLLNHLLEQFRTTLFRQTMFAEFERGVHNKAEEGESLTVAELNRLYGDLNRLYYSDVVETDDRIETEWSRIPHFYNAFYVYQYATGFSAAVAIADRILAEGEPAVKDYLRFLSSGGSNFPVELLKIAGVDLSSREPIDAAMQVFADTLTEFEALTEELK